jgi:hypothetical protein
MFFDIDKQTVKNVAALRAFALTKKAKVKDVVFQDTFEIQYKDTSYTEMNDADIAEHQGSILMYDVESFANYFLVAFRHVNSGKVILCELCEEMDISFDRRKLAFLLNNFIIVGFNSRLYDLPMCTLAMTGASSSELNKASFKLIVDNIWPGDFEKEYDVKIPLLRHIDLIEVAPLSASLKTYAGRLNCKRMQELPANPNDTLTPEKVKETRIYCLNDLCNTELLCDELTPALTLRKDIGEQYGIRVMSKSDAQVAEAIIGKDFQRLTGSWPQKTDIEVGKTHFYRVPSFLHYANPTLQNVLNTVRATPFVVQSNGYITMPEAISNLDINIGNCQYRIGIGGLHSSEKSVVHKATDNMLLLDRDVASYYPMIILNQGLYPKHLGKQFLTIYRGIVERRLKAKASGDKKTAASLKIAINGSFGKLGNPYSFLYSPELMLQVTISGQLCLLLLIDMLECHGFVVVSANTDGVIVKCPVERYEDYVHVVNMWESMTGFDTEETRYSAIYSRDVNNYIAIKTDGEVKRKGAYAEKGSAGDSRLSRNPENFVCIDAVIDTLTNNTPVEETIQSCQDVLRFCTVRNVRGGAVKSGQYLGKTIRWYFSTEMKGDINYLISGNKVPNSDGAKPLMELGESFPADIDFNKYVGICNEMMIDLGVLPQPEKKRRKVPPEDNAPKFIF